MKNTLSLIFPYGAAMALPAFAFLLYGTDTPLSVYFLSGLILLLTAITLAGAPRDATLPGGVFLCVALIAVSALIDYREAALANAAPDYAALAAAGGLFLIGRQGMMHTDRVTGLWTLLLLAFLALGIWSFIDFFVNPDTIFGRPRPYHVDRLSGAFLSANTAATFFGVGMLAAASGIARGLRREEGASPFAMAEGLFRHAPVSLVSFMFCASCLALTGSRAGIVFAAFCLAVLIAWEYLSQRRKGQETPGAGHYVPLAMAAGAVLIAVMFWAMSGDVAVQRYAELGSDTGDRPVLYRAYWGAVFENPLLGNGLGSFLTVNNRIMEAGNADVLAVQGAAHNVFLQWLLQRGWLGAPAMWGTVALILAGIWRGLSRRRRHRGLLRGILVISLFVILHAQVDYALEIPGFMWWWALILGFGAGLAAGGGRLAQRTSSGSTR